MKPPILGLLACLTASITARPANLLFVDILEGLEYSQAQALNATTTVVNITTWSVMSTAEFASYDAIIIGDPFGGDDPSVLQFMVNNSATWGPAITGNIIVIGSDPSNHLSNQVIGAGHLIDAGIFFAVYGHGTGLYLALNQYYNFATNATVDALSYFGYFEVQGQAYAGGCGSAEHIVASGPGLDELTDADLSNWECSYHEVFTSFPSVGPFAFETFAIVDGVFGPGTQTFANGSVGIPYIITRGGIPAGCGDGIWEPLLGEQCDGTPGCCPCCQCDLGYTPSGNGTCIPPFNSISSTILPTTSTLPASSIYTSYRAPNTSIPFANNSASATPVSSKTSTPRLSSTYSPPPYITPTVPEIFIIGVEIIIFIDIRFEIGGNGETTWNTSPCSTMNKPIWNTEMPGYACYVCEMQKAGLGCGCNKHDFVTVTTTSCPTIPPSCTYTPSPPTIQPCSTCLPYTMSTCPAYESSVTSNVYIIPPPTIVPHTGHHSEENIPATTRGSLPEASLPSIVIPNVLPVETKTTTTANRESIIPTYIQAGDASQLGSLERLLAIFGGAGLVVVALL